jgi:predicted nucleic acid-binding protein
VTDAVLVDAGPLVGIFADSDSNHSLCVEQLHKLRSPLLTCWPVLVEASYLLRHEEHSTERLFNLFKTGGLELLTIDVAELPQIAAVMKKYRNLEAQLADAALVHLACREKIDTIFTLDRRDFSVYRAAGNRPFKILPRATL